MHRRLASLFAVCLLLLGLGPISRLAAQPTAEPSTRSAIQFFGYGTGNYADLFSLDARGRETPLQVPRGSRSVTFTYDGPARFRLFRKNPVLGEEEPPFLPVAEVELPPGQADTLLLVIPNPAHREGSANEPEFFLYSVDNSRAAFPANHVTFYNASGADLEGVVGDQEVRLRSGTSTPINVARYFGDRNVLVGLLVRFRGEPRIVLQTRMQFYPGRRTLIVLLPPSSPGSFDVTAFRIQDLVSED